MKLLTLIYLLLCSFSTVCFGQKNTLSSGGESNGSNGSVSYSIGQIDYINFSSNSESINEGLQQPYIISSNQINESHVQFNVFIGPNPTENELIIEISQANDMVLFGYLADINGKIIRESTLLQYTNNWNLGELAPGQYMLSITQKNTIIESFKIIKN